MRIAYVTTYSPDDVSEWSGTGFYMGRALKAEGTTVTHVGPLKDPLYAYAYKAKQLAYRALFDVGYQFYREPSLLRNYARQIEARLRGTNAEIALCPGTTPISYVESDVPLAFWTDSAFGALHDFYPNHSNISHRTLEDGRAAESRLLSTCACAIYSSHWAADFAIRNYDVPEEKVHVVPFGANIDCDRRAPDVEEMIATRDRWVCRLLFVGVDWYRKGGDIAVAVAKELNRRGIPTRLTIVGCSPSGLPDVEWLDQVGFVSKSTAEGRAMLDRLFSRSHFLIVPSRAEAFGLVFCEANSYGLPCIASDRGGIPTIVRDGINGRKFPPDGDVSDCCDFVEETFTDWPAYERLASSSFEEYRKRLNWTAASRSVRSIMESAIGKRQDRPASRLLDRHSARPAGWSLL